jgi:hypothetical protein
MRSARLRRAEGLRPYAGGKARAALQLAAPGYPIRTCRNDLKRALKITTFGAHDKCEYVATNTAAEAVEDFSLGFDIKRRSPLGVERAEAAPLMPRAMKPRIARCNCEKISTCFYVMR